MRFSYNWIKDFTDSKLNAREMAERLTLHSFEVEEVVDNGHDHILDIKILPNRPDALSHWGIAREISAIDNARYSDFNKQAKFKKPDKLKIKVEDETLCLRYSALIIRGIKIKDSPQWLKQRLEDLGLKSINNIVDATNYVMLETGQPLHAFDLGKVDEIIVRRAKKGEKIKTLDEARTEYTLDEPVLVIADSTKPIGIAGTKGGAGTAITDETRDIIIESANFSPEVIRAGSRWLNLRTDASIRFSYGVDPNLTGTALLRATEIITDTAGGKPDEEIIDVTTEIPKEKTIFLNPDYVRDLLGEDISVDQMIQILERLSFKAEKSGGKLKVRVPTFRLDVLEEEDLIEEIGRVFGYENIKPKAPAVKIFDDERDWVKEDVSVVWDEYEFVKERNFISHILASIGFCEVYNYSLISDEIKEIFNFENLPELENPLSHEYKYLRNTLLPRMLVNVKNNFRFFDEVRIFETGHVFESGDNGLAESRSLAIVLAKKKGDDLFFELKSAIDLLMRRLGIDDHWYDDAEPFSAPKELTAMFNPGHFGEIKIGDDVVGFIGEINPFVSERLKIKGRVVGASFDLEKLIKNFQEEREYEPLPKYPAIIRDISIFVDENVKIYQIENIIKTADKSGIIEDVDIFDIFEPSQAPVRQAHRELEKSTPFGDEVGLPQGKNSVAFHIIYRSRDKTLTDEEVDVLEDKIKSLLETKLNAEVR